MVLMLSASRMLPCAQRVPLDYLGWMPPDGGDFALPLAMHHMTCTVLWHLLHVASVLILWTLSPSQLSLHADQLP